MNDRAAFIYLTSLPHTRTRSKRWCYWTSSASYLQQAGALTVKRVELLYSARRLDTAIPTTPHSLALSLSTRREHRPGALGQRKEMATPQTLSKSRAGMGGRRRRHERAVCWINISIRLDPFLPQPRSVIENYTVAARSPASKPNVEPSERGGSPRGSTPTTAKQAVTWASL